MDSFFDVNIDYPFLINSALKNLNKNGMIFFSTNSRTIKLDTALLDKCSTEDVSEKTIPFDFKDKKIHRAWIIKHEDK
jgi:23S rRNA G2069 N7-methylase RlmK/C1962 C5-methylase RlmI